VKIAEDTIVGMIEAVTAAKREVGTGSLEITAWRPSEEATRSSVSAETEMRPTIETGAMATRMTSGKTGIETAGRSLVQRAGRK
jgi:hypothetical protein